MYRSLFAILAIALVLDRSVPAGAEQPAKVLVVNTQDASISLVDLQSLKEEKRIPVGKRPYGIAITPDARTVAVGVEDEETIKFFSLPEGELKGQLPIGKMFNDHLVLTPDGKHMLLANFYSDDVVVIDPVAMKEVGRIEGCSAPHVVKYGPLRKHAYVTCKKITGIAIIDPANQQLVKFHQLNVNPRSLTFSPDESKLYFGSFWVEGFFELDTKSGKVTQLFSLNPPENNRGNQEVTYHGVETVSPNIVLAANEGRSYVDSVDVASGKLLDRLTTAAKPCCVERIPGTNPPRALVSNLGDGTLQLIEISAEGKFRDLGRVKVGTAPKRVAFLPAVSN
jgi:YVTN family beta-propeller protein